MTWPSFQNSLSSVWATETSSCHQSHLLQSLFIATEAAFLMNVSFSKYWSSSALPGIGDPPSCDPASLAGLTVIILPTCLSVSHVLSSAFALPAQCSCAVPLRCCLAQPLFSSPIHLYFRCRSVLAPISRGKSSWAPKAFSGALCPFLCVPHGLPEFWLVFLSAVSLRKCLCLLNCKLFELEVITVHIWTPLHYPGGTRKKYKTIFKQLLIALKR